jgi:hypothetical protein
LADGRQRRRRALRPQNGVIGRHRIQLAALFKGLAAVEESYGNQQAGQFLLHRGVCRPQLQETFEHGPGFDSQAGSTQLACPPQMRPFQQLASFRPGLLAVADLCIFQRLLEIAFFQEPLGVLD